MRSTLSISLDPMLIAELEREAKREGLTRSAIVQRAVRLYLKAERARREEIFAALRSVGGDHAGRESARETR